jgi:hypothetical protein
MATPTPFKINVPDELLKQTREKLLNARLPDQLVDTTWEGLYLPSLPSSVFLTQPLRNPLTPPLFLSSPILPLSSIPFSLQKPS